MENEQKKLPKLRFTLMGLLPIAIIILGFVVFGALVASKKKPGVAEGSDEIPEVSVLALSPTQITLDISGHGTVRPRHEANLTSALAGEIAWISPSFIPGGFVKEKEILVKLDDKTHRIALKNIDAQIQSARAEVARLRQRKEFVSRQLRLAQKKIALTLKDYKRQQINLEKGYISQKKFEEIESAYLQEQQNLLDQEGTLDSLGPEIEMAQASLESLEAEREKTLHQLSQLEVRAPFSAQVTSRQVEMGESVAAGSPLGGLVYDGAYEIPVLVGQETMAKIPSVPGASVPERYRGLTEIFGEPPATIYWSAGNKTFTWEGKLVRIEPVDTQTRTFPLIVEVQDPWSHLEKNAPPLMTGYYCRVIIQGRQLDTAANAFLVPESAIRENDTVYLLIDNKLDIVPVEILQRTGQEVVVRPMDGAMNLDGKLLITSNITYPVRGMPLRAEPVENPETGKGG